MTVLTAKQTAAYLRRRAKLGGGCWVPLVEPKKPKAKKPKAKKPKAKRKH
jgi:hypothetical protein